MRNSAILKIVSIKKTIRYKSSPSTGEDLDGGEIEAILSSSSSFFIVILGLFFYCRPQALFLLSSSGLTRGSRSNKLAILSPRFSGQARE